MAENGFPNEVLNDYTGEQPKVSDSLQVENRTIGSVDQAFAICEAMVNDWKKGITTSARITAKLNGERPYNQSKLKNAGKDWKTNISTGFLGTECSKVIPRFYMPLKTAKYLTASSLPPDWPNGQEKTNYFRQCITETIRSWPKFNFYIRGLAREVGIWGFAFNAWFDEWEWRPTLIRMDKGFVPQGTEIMEEPAFFAAKWDYKPNELLDLLRANVEAGLSDWKVDNVVKAINAAQPPPVDATYPNARSYEELIRQSSWTYTYSKGAKVIRTYHLFAKETSGKVSHYVLWADGSLGSSNPIKPAVTDGGALLFEKLDQYDSMADAVNAMVFDYGDGTIHGSWGAGQILYDLAVQVEKIRNDSIDNLRMTNKMKINVPESKNANDVKLVVNDQMIVVTGGQFAGNTAGISSEIEGYASLDQRLTQLAQEKIGAFVPPIPLQPSDIKAAQVNAAMMKERELQEALLENWLIQFAFVVKTITKRLLNPSTPDAVARNLQAKLLQKLTVDEIVMLADQFPVQSVMDFTEYAAQKRGLFAASVKGDPLFNQNMVARVMAEGAGDETFVKAIVNPAGDNTNQIKEARQQQLENAAMTIGQTIPVAVTDDDWVHMQTLKPELDRVLDANQPQLAKIALQHYAAHWTQGVNKKVIPDEEINAQKQYIASAEKLIEQQEQSASINQTAQQLAGQV